MHTPGQKRRRYTEAEAFQKLSALCAAAEYCKADIRQKLSRWELGSADSTEEQAATTEEPTATTEEPTATGSEPAAERILARLVRERYIDENRYAHAFVRDKFRYNRWGRVRIAQELRRKGIPADTIDDALAELPEADTLDTLRRLLQQKRPTVKGNTDYEVNMKLIRFALSRGFELDAIRQVMSDEITI